MIRGSRDGLAQSGLVTLKSKVLEGSRRNNETPKAQP